MDIKIGGKVHNRFDIEVKDVVTGKIVQRAEAENIVLNSAFGNLYETGITNGRGSDWLGGMLYGRGTGVLSRTRTELFSPITTTKLIGTIEDEQYSPQGTASWRKYKFVILTNVAVGETITEVGLTMKGGDGKIETHALLKDAEGNQISIGPKTDTQEITIYATVFAEVVLPDGVDLLFRNSNNSNAILNWFLGQYGAMAFNYSYPLNFSSNKEETIPNKDYTNLQRIGSPKNNQINDYVSQDVVGNINKLRLQPVDNNGKIWSIVFGTASNPGFRILFPNSLWGGYHFESKEIGLGNGSKIKFILPWSDINIEKPYKFYKDGVLQIENTDYTLENSESETSLTFTTAPADELPITGDWWVDYIPKSTENILDLRFRFNMSEGV